MESPTQPRLPPNTVGLSTQPQSPPNAMESSTQPQLSPNAMGSPTQPQSPPNIVESSTQPRLPANAMGSSTQSQLSSNAVGSSTQPQLSPNTIGLSTQPQSPPNIMGSSTQPGLPANAMESSTQPQLSPNTMGSSTQPQSLPTTSRDQSTRPQDAGSRRTTSPSGTHEFLLDHESQKPSSRSHSKFEILCKTLKLKLLFAFYARLWGRRVAEEEKVAISKSRTDAVLRCAIHVVPISGAIGLVSLNAIQSYIGGELSGKNGQDDEKLAALQFTAKLHELLMLASIGTIVFTYIRRELVLGEGVPFGAIFAGLQFESISLFWSMEFWGIVYNTFQKRHKKWFLITTIILCTLLGVSVGPSTANLMRPRLDNWPAGGTTFWINATDELLSPSFVDASPSMTHCEVDLGDASCPYGDWHILNDAYFSFWPNLAPLGDMPESLYMPGKFSLAKLSVRQRSTDDRNRTIWQNAFTVATLPPSAVSDGVAEVGRLWAFAVANVARNRRFWTRNDATFTTLAPQPFTQATCQELQVSLGDLAQLEFEFPILGDINENGMTFSFRENESAFPDTEAAFAQVKALLLAGAPPALTWMDDPALLAVTNSTLNVIATFPDTKSNSEAAVLCCSIDSRLTQTEISTTRNAPKVVTGEPTGWVGGTFSQAWPRINLTAAWARYLNPTIPGQNATIFSTVASTAGMWNTTTLSASYNHPFIVETILATMTVNGLARMSYNSAIVGSLKGNPGPWEIGVWTAQIIPKGSLGSGGSIYDVTTDQQKTATMFTVQATVNGYAYASKGAVQRAAMGVLLFYSLMALAHIAYSCTTGWSSTSWASVPEIAALAMNSQRTEKLKNTGAGISTAGVYEERVWIRARDDHLEFVFKDTGAGMGGQNTTVINRNQPYG